MAQVIWTKKALSQLERSVKYIVEEQGPSYAEIVLNKILTATRNLSDFPKMGQAEPFLSHKKFEYRYVVAWSYKIVYRIKGTKVTISRIFHTSQDPKQILS
ncbi:MAG: type II toxin-antitoxin system RelE/ParE family toxin [Ignavibacteria bacterium]|nr:type II toxin-antitoxin system RelE/ParE family toxin [Ignavibacteria bacterium]